MSVIWGVHSDRPDLNVQDQGVVAIGWDEVGDLTAIGPDREAFKEAVAATYPQAKKGSIPVTAGVLYRFACEMQIGDLIIYPYKPDRSLHFGKVTGDYFYDISAPAQRNRRKVDWFRLGVPRPTFSQGALSELGSLVTIFRVKNHADEFDAFLSGGGDLTQEVGSAQTTEEPSTATTQAEDALVASRIDEYTRDFVIKTLLSISPTDFEWFVAGLLEAMGYRTQVTPASGDGGVDVIASQDPLGLGPPVIKIQCKRTAGAIGAPDVQRLVGTLAGSQQGLFVTLGSYSPQAVQQARTKADIRLIAGEDLTAMIFEHYENLADRWKRVLPLRSVYAVDEGPQD